MNSPEVIVNPDHLVVVSREEFDIAAVKTTLPQLFEVLKVNDLDRVIMDNRQTPRELRAVEKTMFAAAVIDAAGAEADYMKGRVLRIAVLVPPERMPLFKAFEEMIERVADNIETLTFNDPKAVYEWLGVQEPVEGSLIS